MVQLPSIHLQYSGTQHRAKGSVEREFTSIPESALRDELPKGHDLLDSTRGTSHIRYSRKPVGRSTLVRARYWYYSSTCMPCVQACRYRGGMIVIMSAMALLHGMLLECQDLPNDSYISETLVYAKVSKRSYRTMDFGTS